ncbi:MAG: PRC-barrel domain-containing protein [Nitrososphaerales archaeon]
MKSIQWFSKVSSGSSTSGKAAYLAREDVVGKTVLGLDAKKVGTVKDLAISMDGKVAIQIDTSDPSKEPFFVSSDEIMAVGDVVLLRHSSSLAGKESQVPSQTPPVLVPGGSTPLPPPPQGKACPRCNYLNVSSSRFCIKCGQSLS